MGVDKAGTLGFCVFLAQKEFLFNNFFNALKITLCSGQSVAELMALTVSEIVADYRRKRDLLMAGLEGYYEFAKPGGAFYLFVKSPWGTGAEFVAEAVRNNLLIIPGGVFSSRDTHFRVSYAASDETLHRGIDILRKLIRK